MSAKKGFGLVAAIWGSFICSAPTLAENLFIPVKQRDSLVAHNRVPDATAMYTRYYSVNTGAVTEQTETLTFNLGGGVNVDMARVFAKRNAQGSLVWEGRLQDAFMALRDGSPDQVRESAVLVKNGRAITGTLRVDNRLFRIRHQGNGVHSVSEIDESLMPDDHPHGAQKRWQESQRERRSTLADSGPYAGALADGPADIRVLVPYTAKAKGRVGNMNSEIELAIAETNAGYRNSGVNASVTLAGSFEVSYTENNDMGRDLDRLISRTDGVMDNVHSERDRTAADVVVLITDTDDGCGLASSIGAREDNAFAIARWNCATGYYTFGHEIGHLLSARHDPDTDGSTRPYAFGHGYRYSPGNWRTIMAYSCQGGCRRINFWSNPDIRRGGVPMGTSSRSDNVRVLNITTPRVAGFRSGGSTPTPTQGFQERVDLPGVVQAENYYRAPVETTSDNRNSRQITKCRYYGLGVDVQDSSRATCNVGWTTAGEQLVYRIGNAGGRYTLHVAAASTQNGRRIRISVNGNVVGTVSTAGAGWQSYTEHVISNIDVPNNANVTVTFLDGSANLDFIRFERANTNPTPTVTPTPQPTPTPAPTATPSPGQCTTVGLRERAEVSLQNSNCVRFEGDLSGKTLAIWDSDVQSCDFRGRVVSVDGAGSLTVSSNYIRSDAFSGRTVRFEANNGCNFVKVRYY